MPGGAKTTRTRALGLASGSGRFTNTGTFKPTGAQTNLGTSKWTYAISGRQSTVSEGHHWYGRSASDGDVGGDFFTTRSYIANPGVFSEKHVETVTGDDFWSYRRKYDGPWVAPFEITAKGDPAYPPSAHSSNGGMDRLGATAVARCEPTNSAADLTTALGEFLREGIPSSVGAFLLGHGGPPTPQKVGDEYLGLQFGLRPLVDDFIATAYGVVDMTDIIAQYERDAGKVVRRKYSFPREHSISESVLSFNKVPYGPDRHDIVSSGGVWVRRRETVVSRWFSGAFTYHLPTGYDSRSKLDKARLAAERLGLNLTPENIWDLTPWSWAIDWFSNAGDVLSNVSSYANQGLIMRYGYLMEHSTVKDTYSLEGFTLNNGVRNNPPAGAVTLVTETKQRRKANPFGFGLTWEGLSPFQLSIAGALGLSKRG